MKVFAFAHLFVILLVLGMRSLLYSQPGTTVPRVFFSFAHADDLADETKIPDWKYVAANLDGIWLNGAESGFAAAKTVVERIRPKNVILIINIPDVRPILLEQNKWVSHINNWSYQPVIEGACLVQPPEDWLLHDMEQGKAQTVPLSAPEAYKVERSGEWKVLNDTNQKLAEDSDGGVLELNPQRMQEDNIFRNLYKTMYQAHKERGNKVMWLMTHGTIPADSAWLYTESVLWCYNYLKEENIMPDVFIVSDHGVGGNNHPWFPESNPDGTPGASVTGAAYALLKQIRKDYPSSGIADKVKFIETNSSHFSVTLPGLTGHGLKLPKIFTGNNSKKITIYNTLGSQLPPARYSIKDGTINFTSIPPGSYILKIRP